ncbi:histone acetyltransferase KAT7 [Parus major]|uniref:histone acetyltransferase KAT7 n=1 Tax=Parus major TaxID=9157 RepID=UPI001444240C|nr:histone acetyltransferase KAT7 [Parus major]
MQRRKRNAGSSSDGTEDSDFSTDPEHTDSSESDGTSRRSARVTRSSARLSQSSQDSSPVRNPPALGADEPVYSTRRVTRSQQQPAPVTPKKYPLRQTRSSGSETEQAVDFSDRGRRRGRAAPAVRLPGALRRPRGVPGAPPHPNVSHDESLVRAQSRDKQIEERMLAHRQDDNNRHATRHQAPTERQLRYKEKVAELRKKRNSGLSKEQKEKYMEHRQTYGNTREPLLENLTSEYDLELFRRAQARASEDLEKLRLQGQITEGSNMIKTIAFGRYELDTWYHSPYPEEYARLGRLYMCEFCLKYMKSQTIIFYFFLLSPVVLLTFGLCHWNKHLFFSCVRAQIYCQNLCLLAKLFLDHKTLYYDVEPFLFYVMTEADNTGCHLIGYFSKEKNSFLNYNVSCILTMPQYMRQGYGKMLIDFSYLLSKVEEKVGSPERPLSDLGLISYRSYWKEVLLRYLHNFQGKEISIKEISQETAVNPVDIVSTLQALQMLKYWKGKHLVLKSQDLIDEWIAKEAKRSNSNKTMDPSCLKWTPPKGT